RPHRLLKGTSLALNPTTRPWIQGDPSPRRAGVNAFGFAGINTHAVLEEHTPSAEGGTPGAMPRWDSEAILLGAAGRNASVPLKDLAYTLNTGQTPFPLRLGLVAASTADLREKLRAAVAKLN